MLSLRRLVAAHPLVAQEPYKRIKYSRVDQNGTPVYKVGKGKTEFGAEQALRIAFKRFGGRCFHCGRSIVTADKFTLDHLRPVRDGGDAHLHNLVFACDHCNRKKAATDLVTFRPSAGAEYLKALDEHLVRCLSALQE